MNIDIVKAELFTKYYNSRNSGCLLKRQELSFKKIKNYFMKMILSIWNLLPWEAIKANSSRKFKERLDKAFKNTSSSEKKGLVVPSTRDDVKHATAHW